MRIGYLDCFSGVAGDMLVGAMLDAGLALADLEGPIASLGLPGVSVTSARVHRASLAGTHFRVRVDGDLTHHRHLSDILAILEGADLPTKTQRNASAVFRALGEVEAAAHGCDIEKVHFHEVGAEDTIVDITAACLGVELLGIEALYCSAVTTGSGTVECAHGTMPVPAPGALGNLAGVPIRSGGPPGELVTPTGAAFLRVMVKEFEPMLTWVPETAGYGAGTRDPEHVPNLLRLTIGHVRDPGSAQQLSELTCDLDTATGEQLGHLLESLLAHGAVEAFASPVHMKKGRPGFQLTALADQAHRDGVARLMLEESSSLGVRMHAVERQVLERWEESLDTELGAVRFKAARLPSGRVAHRPEADEIARLVIEHKLSRAEVAAILARHG